MAKKKSKAKKKPSNVVVRGKKGYQKMLAILLKYYGYGPKNLYFKTYSELRKEAGQITIQFRLDDKKITLKNVREFLPARRKKNKPPIPVLPPKWDEIQPYWLAKERLRQFAGWSKDLYIYAPMILGYDIKGNANTLRCGNLYSYDSTLADMYDHFNELSIERVSPSDYCIRLFTINKDNSPEYDKKTGLYKLYWILCNSDGTKMQSNFAPVGIEPKVTSGNFETPHNVGSEKEVEPPAIKPKETPIIETPASENIKLKELERDIEIEKTKQAQSKAEEEKSKVILKALEMLNSGKISQETYNLTLKSLYK